MGIALHAAAIFAAFAFLYCVGMSFFCFATHKGPVEPIDHPATFFAGGAVICGLILAGFVGAVL